MKSEANSEKLLIRYLLGNLPEEHRLQVEEEFLSDDHSYERLLALENDLFYDYAQNRLSPGEREQFEKRLLSSERNRKRAMTASALAHKLSESAPVEVTEVGAADQEPRHFWQSLNSYFTAQSVAMRVSLAALTLTLICLVIGIVRLRNEYNQFRVQWAVQEDQLRQQFQQERARADESNLKLEHETTENAMLRRELSKMRAQSRGREQDVTSMISLILAPTVREQAGMKKLYLPPGAGLLRLRLKLKGGVEYKSYQVTLLTAEGAEIWSHAMLQARRTGSAPSIDLWLPARTLAPGDYELRLKGYGSDGTLEETGDYYLSVRRK
jgi:anti-sigma factor RsiW